MEQTQARWRENIAADNLVGDILDREAPQQIDNSLLLLDEPDTLDVEPSPNIEFVTDIIPLSTLRTVLNNMRNPDVIAKNRVVHERLSQHVTRYERKRLLEIIGRVEFFERDTVPNYLACARMRERKYVRLECGFDVSIGRFLRWVCDANLTRFLADSNLAAFGEHCCTFCTIRERFDIFCICKTPECVNPQHYRRRARNPQDELGGARTSKGMLLIDYYAQSRSAKWVKNERMLTRAKRKTASAFDMLMADGSCEDDNSSEYLLDNIPADIDTTTLWCEHVKKIFG